MMLQNLSIRNRLLFLSGALILMIAGVTYYLTTKLADNSRAVMHNAELAELIDIAQDVRNIFGQYRYWTTDLAVSLLSQSEANAKAARERLIRRLDDLAVSKPDEVAALKRQVADFEKAGRAIHRRSAGPRQHVSRPGAPTQRAHQRSAVGHGR
jgi:hypothetical protein